MPANPHDRLMCLDIETVPDRSLMPADWPEGKFPAKPLWHRVVAISFVEARIEPERDTGVERYAVTACRPVGEAGWVERDLLEAFWASFARSPARVVSWAGRQFDIPVLLVRSLVHAVPAPVWYRSGTKWENYTQRFGGYHTDLMEQLADHGACARMGLDEVARALGLPGKVGGYGSQVEEMAGRGELDRVRAYCEADCLNLFGLYCRFALLTGRVDRAGHEASLGSLTAYLDGQRAARPILGEFLDRWQASASSPSAPAPASVAALA